MSWCINEIEQVACPIHCMNHRGSLQGNDHLQRAHNYLCFDGDASFLFDLQGIKYLAVLCSTSDAACNLQESICKSALPMINVGDDTEISYTCRIKCL